MEAVSAIGSVAGPERPDLSAGVEGVDLSLVMSDHGARMAGLDSNGEAGRIDPALGSSSDRPSEVRGTRIGAILE
ncbi:MAG TPA: hypothetical protein VIJ21_02210 [Solirubrobacterales bacterium]